MTPQNSSTGLSRLTVVALLALLLQISGGAPNAAVAGQPIRGTPIDSAPETNAPTAPIVLQAKPTSTSGSPTNTNRGFLEIGFDKLSGFSAEVTYEESVTNGVTFIHATKMTGEIPQTIKTLDNQKVAVKGFMLPLRQENGLTTDFILLRNRMMCCYGMMPKINEWIHVRMDGKGVGCIMDIPVTICGKLHVEGYRENRTMLGIYRLDGEKLEAPGDS
jgi:hypothetical protein